MSCSIRHPEDCVRKVLPIVLPIVLPFDPNNFDPSKIIEPFLNDDVPNPFPFPIEPMRKLYEDLPRDQRILVDQFKISIENLGIKQEHWMANALLKTHELMNEFDTDHQAIANNLADHLANSYKEDAREVGKFIVCTVVVRAALLLVAVAIAPEAPTLSVLILESATTFSAGACLAAFPDAAP
ncbi:hypothetical protein ACFVS2_10265 [Brevibacillus sp. NPDC058079]|uniref:hypothetical protein n=1 Tax=Brevibacillus sp. NPDC058079 TaxID=3346330 RepID=UPI0036E247F9